MTPLTVPLSVLDLCPVSEGMTPSEALHASLDLAEVVDRAGYSRLWIAEHHNTEVFISTATEVLIALAAARTRHIRVGSGGVMLPNHSPLKVAENFQTLEALYPGRIDLGLGRAPGTDGRTALALRRSQETYGGDDFPVQIALLEAFAGKTPWPPGAVFQGVAAQPQAPLPPLWILGSSLYGAQLAGRLGVGYAFAYHFSQEDPVQALDTYRRHFQPGPLAEPYAILGVNALAAPGDEEAETLALSTAALSLGIISGQRAQLRSPGAAAAWLRSMNASPEALLRKVIRGAPGKVTAGLADLAARTGAQELMVTTYVFDPELRRRSYELLAGAAGLVTPA